MNTSGSKAALVVGSAFMHDLGSLFPVAMTLAGDELAFTFLSSCSSSGEVEHWVRQRSGIFLAGRIPRFSVDTAGRRILVKLAGTQIRALIVLAADVTAAAVNAPHLGPWQGQVPCTVGLALDELARTLSRCHHRTGGAEPLIDLSLAYRPDRDYPARLDRAHRNVHPFIAPVRPVLSLRWRSATPGQRKAFRYELQDGGRGRTRRPRRRKARIMGVEVEVAP